MAKNRSTRGNSLALTIGAGLALLFLVGVIFSVTRSTHSIVRDADALHDADEALRGITVVRAQLELVTLQRSVLGDPTAQEQAVMDAGITEAEEALQAAATGIEGVINHEGSASLAASAGRFLSASQEALIGLRGGEISQLDDMRTTFDLLAAELSGVRGRLADAVSTSDRGLTSLGTLAGFLVAFAIPAGIMLVYRELSRRQARQKELEVHLDAERSINAGRERFIATASHELRSPLTTVLGMAHVLADEPDIMGHPEHAEMVGLMISEAEDLTRLVEDLLTASRIEADAIHYAFETVDVVSEIETVMVPFEAADRVLDIEVGDGSIRVDRLRFRQMVRNLVSNAIKYGGNKISVRGRRRGNTYVLTVIDDGEGVAPDVAPRLFERFVHRGRETAGTQSVGLGLSIVMALAVGMGGTAYYDRKGGKTHFGLVLPLAVSEPTEGESEPARLAS